jgi:pilus assembly protein Flp/PilA
MIAQTVKTRIIRFLNDESGATAIEYGLIASLIAVALISGATSLGNNTSSSFTFISKKIRTS